MWCCVVDSADMEECSSIGRAPVSKTGGWGFESLHSCQGWVKLGHLVQNGSF